MDYEAAAVEFIRLTGQCMRHSGHRRLEKSCLGEGRILMHLQDSGGSATAGELREALAVGTGRVANALKNLEAKGLIRRGPSPQDGRVVRVYLTEAGSELVRTRRALLRTRVTCLLQELGQEDAEASLRILGRVAALCDEWERKDGAVCGAEPEQDKEKQTCSD